MNAFKMKLKEGCSEEYEKRHQNIWPGLKDLLKESGLNEYSIWLDRDTNILFAIQHTPDDFDHVKLSEQSIMKEWWAYMKDIMETNEDFSPMVKDMKKMFYLK